MVSFFLNKSPAQWTGCAAFQKSTEDWAGIVFARGGFGRGRSVAAGIYLVDFWLVGYRAKLHNRSTPWCFCR